VTDRGKDVSNALTEVRTVHSRAKSALDKFERGYGMSDPDRERMIGALNEVVALLDEWKRTKR
jgi:hypothetical protein